MSNFQKLISIAVFLVLMFGVGLSLSIFSQEQETITISTYYPSPFGVYGKLQLYPRVAELAATCDANAKGTLYFNSGEENVYVCSGNPPEWRPIEGLWRKNGTRIYNYNYNTANSQVIIGSNTNTGENQFKLYVYGTIKATGGVDLAEGILASEDVEASDVVILDSSNPSKVVKSSQAYDPRVVGVISEKPGLQLGPETGSQYRPLAFVGRVFCKVTSEGGAIKPGDLLTTSSKPGYAMKASFLELEQTKNFNELKLAIAENTQRKSAIIGRALEALEEGEGKISVLVIR